MNAPNYFNIYNPVKIPLEKRNTQKEIIKYLSLYGLKCVAILEEGLDSIECREMYKVGKYYVMKPHDTLEDELRFSNPKDKGYLPEYKEMLDNPFFIIFADIGDFEDGDENKYVITIKLVDTDILKHHYDRVNNYDSLLYMWFDTPIKKTKRLYDSDFKDVETEIRKAMEKSKIMVEDPYVKDLDVDPKEFYSLVDHILEKESENNTESLSSNVLVNDIFKDIFELNKKLFQDYSIIYRFDSVYFDVGEFVDWVTEGD